MFSTQTYDVAIVGSRDCCMVGLATDLGACWASTDIDRLTT